ncbi:MAG: nucleoside triphosphate pyrophosphohydrolase [Rhodobacteraceae bacterium]|nr:nucleoside triphosphate pyrophosphohydrolase [Paracoccaceae bacterium]
MPEAPIPFDHPFRTGDLPKLETLRQIIAALRDPETGCPWDVEQDFATIAPYTIEEAYEVADAIQRGNSDDLCEELGDLLLQVIYHSQMASEDGSFTLDDVIRGISTKMVRRHPHVFGDAKTREAGVAKGFWETIKASEKAARGREQPASALDDVPLPLPALTRAEKLQKRAARHGFDWPDAQGPLGKVSEEFSEFTDAAQKADEAQMSEEFGDLLFSMVNLARHHEIDPEEALRQANAKFTRRFQHVETRSKEEGRSLEASNLDEMDALWNEAKTRGL